MLGVAYMPAIFESVLDRRDDHEQVTVGGSARARVSFGLQLSRSCGSLWWHVNFRKGVNSRYAAYEVDLKPLTPDDAELRIVERRPH